MAIDTAIREELVVFAEEISGWNDKKLIAEGKKRDIPEADTLPRVTLQDAIVRHERDRLRAEAYPQPQTGGSDNLHSNPGPDTDGVEAKPKE